MKCSFFPALLLLAVLGPYALGEPKAVRNSETQVGVFMVFENQQSELSQEEMKQELQSIMSASRMHLDWRVLKEGSPIESFPELVVVKFKGKCEMGHQPSTNSGSGTLASTHTSDGQVLPFVDVECDAIRSLVGAAARTADAKRREYLLGRALGRVLAHEFYHVFAKTSHHGRGGIAKSCFTARELVADKFAFEASDRKKLRLPPQGSVVAASSVSTVSVQGKKALK